MDKCSENSLTILIEKVHQVSNRHRVALPTAPKIFPAVRRRRSSAARAPSVMGDKIRAEQKLAKNPCLVCRDSSRSCWVGSMSAKCANCADLGIKVSDCGVDFSRFEVKSMKLRTGQDPVGREQDGVKRKRDLSKDDIENLREKHAIFKPLRDSMASTTKEVRILEDSLAKELDEIESKEKALQSEFEGIAQKKDAVKIKMSKLAELRKYMNDSKFGLCLI